MVFSHSISVIFVYYFCSTVTFLYHSNCFIPLVETGFHSFIHFIYIKK